MATKLKETKLTAKSSHKRIIAGWTKRLRSRKYKQTTGKLHRKDNETGKHGFCCLGVLCEMAVEAGVIPVPELDESGTYSTLYVYDNDESVLPEVVRDWAGLQETDGAFETKKGNNTSLADVNDGGKKFGAIAKIIESRPTGLFA